MQIGERLRAARVERKMSLADLARASQLSKGFISQVESGLSNPSLVSLMKLAASLGLPPGSFFEEATVEGSRNAALKGMVYSPGVEEFTALSVFSLKPGDGAGIVPVLSERGGSVAALTSLPIGSRLEGAGPEQASSGSGLCTVLRGAVRIVQGPASVTVRQGDVATFNAGEAYSIAGLMDEEAMLLVVLPPGCELPICVEYAPLVEPLQTTPTQNSKLTPQNWTGPFRLVEMRAAMRAVDHERGRSR